MYDFLMSEEWWMEAIIISIVTTLGTVLVAIIGYNYKIKTIYKNSETMLGFKDFFIGQHGDLSKGHGSLSKEHGSLSKEHGSLSKEHGDLSKEHGIILERTKITQATVIEIAKEFVEEKTKEQMRYDNLSVSQREIVDATAKLHSVGTEIKMLVEQVNTLQGDIQRITIENFTLKEENIQLKKEKQIQKEKLQKDKGFER